MIVKINFTDFWVGFSKTNNYFYNLLSKEYEIIISEEPDILFFSCYGEDYLQYNCIRIFYSAENIRPDFAGCDYALSFDYLTDPRHFRLPLYALYIEQGNSLQDLLLKKSKEQATKIWEGKSKFCCMVVSNPKGKRRLDFFHKLSRYRQVDSGGKWKNNVGGPVADKLDFIKDYKFVIAFENSSFPGYTTEKILEPLSKDCIPIYWGNPLIERDFNNKRFINYDDYRNEDEMIQVIMDLEKDPEKAVEMLVEPKFNGNLIPECIKDENVLLFLAKIISQQNTILPVARISRYRLLHTINRKNSIAQHYVGKLFGRNFR